MNLYYLDHAATTPLDERVLAHMIPYMKNQYGNPSSLHPKGIEVKRAINTARASIAQFFAIEPEGVIFTSGGTEAINLAIRGTAKKYPLKNEIITSVIEHRATLNTLNQLEKEGYKVTYLPVDKEGFIALNELEDAITDKTLMFTIIMGNNEIATIQDIKAIGEICNRNKILLHVDAVQVVQYQMLAMHDLKIDFLTLSAHKFYGPKGIGALLAKDRNKLEPILYGGNQEKGLRSGTENVYGIMGMAYALQLAHKEQKERIAILSELTETFTNRLRKLLPSAVMNGPHDIRKRVPGLLSVSFPHVDGHALTFSLNQKGLCVSSGSACQSNEITTSHVLKAIHQDQNFGTIRISFGRENSINEIDDVIHIISSVVNKASYSNT